MVLVCLAHLGVGGRVQPCWFCSRPPSDSGNINSSPSRKKRLRPWRPTSASTTLLDSSPGAETADNSTARLPNRRRQNRHGESCSAPCPRTRTWPRLPRKRLIRGSLTPLIHLSVWKPLPTSVKQLRRLGARFYFRYSESFESSGGIFGNGGNFCELPFSRLTVFSACLVPSCTAILCGGPSE
jgi:hypothetical protein